LSQTLAEVVGNVGSQYLHLALVLIAETASLALICVDGILDSGQSLNVFNSKLTLDALSCIYLVTSSVSLPMALKTLFQDQRYS
jgi:hypothetical protein